MKQDKFLCLEFGRFAAAVMVMLFHYQIVMLNLRGTYVFDGAFSGGHSGVEYFFVLSGFIIYHIHKLDVGRPEALRGFLIKRGIRIYPTFWLFWGLTLVGQIAMNGSVSLNPLDPALLPMNGNSIVHQSWSLRNEIVFYALFSALILNARIGWTLISVWLASSLIYGLNHPYIAASWFKPFLYLYNIGFGVGIAVAWLTDRVKLVNPWAVAGIGGAIYLAALVAEWYFHSPQTPSNILVLGGVASPLIYIFASAILVTGMAQIVIRSPITARIAEILGGASYVIYICHALTGSVLVRLLGGLPVEVAFFGMVAGTVAISIVFHLIVEKPLLAWLRSILLYRKTTVPQTV
jgi:exopolysaccharide production protein ExoZ